MKNDLRAATLFVEIDSFYGDCNLPMHFFMGNAQRIRCKSKRSIVLGSVFWILL